MKKDIETVKADVVIVGSGAAGSRSSRHTSSQNPPPWRPWPWARRGFLLR